MPTLNIGDHVHHCTIFRGNEIIEMAFKSLNQKFQICSSNYNNTATEAL